MKAAIAACIFFWLIAAICFCWSMRVPAPLPHRPVDAYTSWGQGRTPADNVCPPGTIRFELDDGIFLECFRTGGSR